MVTWLPVVRFACQHRPRLGEGRSRRAQGVWAQDQDVGIQHPDQVQIDSAAGLLGVGPEIDEALPGQGVGLESAAAVRPAEGQAVIVYCHHGRRSLQTAATLRGMGYTNVLSMAGGIDLWSIDVDPGVARY